MTFIQSSTYSYTRKLVLAIVLLSCAAIASVVALILLYEDTVRVTRETARMREESVVLQNDNAELQHRILSTFDSSRVQEVVAQRGLVAEKNPYYIKLDYPWLFASRY